MPEPTPAPADEPWAVWAEPAAPEAEAPPALEEEPAAAGDLPWLTLDEEEPAAPAAEAEAPAGSAGAPAAEAGEEELPGWLSWGAEAEDAAPAPVQAETPAVEEPPVQEPDAEDFAGVEDFLSGVEGAAAEEALAAPYSEEAQEEPAPEEPTVAGVHAAAAGAGPELSGALGEVAERLERIARTLREDPQALLAGEGRDPLELLVTGFALGYAQGRARG